MNYLKNTLNGLLGLSRKSDNKRTKSVAIDLMRESDTLCQHDIDDWRYACQRAANVGNPDRNLLYDIYGDVQLDLHLSGCIGQVNGFVKCRPYKIVAANGKEDAQAARYFEAGWFKALEDYVLEARYWGHSLIEMGNVVNGANGLLAFDGVKLIPRKHVCPEYGKVKIHPHDSWRSGVDYREPPYVDWLIEVGRADSLGIFQKAALQTIPKKYALAFWDTFASMFGIPIRVATMTSNDNTEREKVAKMMERMGTDAWGVFGNDVDIKLVESTKGDAYNVFDKRVDTANKEMSKLVLDQTMTIENGSSLSQSETHLKVFEHIVDSECGTLATVVNDQLIPLMARHGFPVDGLYFVWDDPVKYTPEQQRAIETVVVQNYEVPGSYFEDKYGIPAGDRREGLSGAGVDASEESTNGERPFFD